MVIVATVYPDYTRVTKIVDEVTVVEALDHREDLSVHIKLSPLGPWHKKAIGGHRTACGDPVIDNYAIREETYTGTGKLCETCFTPYERSIAAAVEDAKRAT